MDAIAAGAFWCPDPWAAEPATARAVFANPSRGSLPFEMLPLFYAFRSRAGKEFWICIFSTYGRPTHVFLPEQDCLIYDYSQHLAPPVLESLLSTIEVARPILEHDCNHLPCAAEAIGLLDMQTNFGHQLINHLSGLQRLVDLGLLDQLDEIWLCGVEFFGPTETLFPETRGRIRRFRDRWAVSQELLRSPRSRLFKIGSNVFQARLRERILRKCPSASAATGREGALLAVTVRATGRRCVNLPEAVAGIFARLSPAFPGLRIVLDGWVFPESELVAGGSSVATALSPRYLQPIRNEMALAQAVADALPPGAVAGNVIGLSIRESLAHLAGIDAYLAHVGTLQHKLGFFTDAGGVVHGPTAQLQTIEGGSFLTEVGRAPLFLPPGAVEDVPVESARGTRFYDYRIRDLDAVADRLRDLIADALAAHEAERCRNRAVAPPCATSCVT